MRSFLTIIIPLVFASLSASAIPYPSPCASTIGVWHRNVASLAPCTAEIDGEPVLRGDLEREARQSLTLLPSSPDDALLGAGSFASSAESLAKRGLKSQWRKFGQAVGKVFTKKPAAPFFDVDAMTLDEAMAMALAMGINIDHPVPKPGPIFR